MRAILGPVFVLLAFAVVSLVRPELLHLPSLLLTAGGALAVICFSYSPRQLRDLAQMSRGLLVERPMTPREFADELSRLTQLYRTEGLRGLELAEHRLSDAFLRRVVGMLVDLQKEEEIHATMEREVAETVNRHELSRQVLHTLGKLLPAFGLIGTLVGMVLLLHDLYNQDIQSLPAALSLAVLTTLYGAVLANVVVAPLAARLHAAATEKEIRQSLTFAWAIMLVRGNLGASVVHHLGAQRPVVARHPTIRDKHWALLHPSLQR